MPRFHASLIALSFLSALLVVGCTPRRGGSGGGGGGTSDQTTNAQTGPGRSLGNASSGGSMTGMSGEGDSTLWVVNLTGSTLTWTNGYECSERDWFGEEGTSVPSGRYLEVSGLIGGCWSVSAETSSGAWFEHEVANLDGDYTWVLESEEGGDDDDDDGPVEDGAWVGSANESEYDFEELVAYETSDLEEVELCSPWRSGAYCESRLPPGTWLLVAFTQEGRAENQDNCYAVVAQELESSPGSEFSLQLDQTELECLGEEI